MVGVRVTNSNLKRAVRARMTETGENYTTALRAVREARMSAYPPHGPGRWPAVASPDIEMHRRLGWVMWAGAEPRPGEETRHKHTAPDGHGFAHRHVRGAESHDHPPLEPL
jgi:hypothetical protein